MKTKNLKISLLMVLLMVLSCDEPQTTVTNYVHRDGSVTRVIEMQTPVYGLPVSEAQSDFPVSDVQLHYDSSWIIKDTIEVLVLDEGRDTLLKRRVEKTFKSFNEINYDYRNDSSDNGEFSRSVSFKKQFRWFNTEFYFSENVDKIMEFGLPVKDFLTEEELTYFYSPEYRQEDQENGPDSLKLRSLRKSISEKLEICLAKSTISEWIGQFDKLTSGNAEMLVNELRSKQDEIYDKIVTKYSEKFDSLCNLGVVQRDFMGEENASVYKMEADSAFSIVTEHAMADFKEYSVRMVLPGKLIATNGFVDSTGILIWPVSSDYFMTEPYKMWAKSKVANPWTWIVSGLFVIFVLTGIALKINKRG